MDSLLLPRQLRRSVTPSNGATVLPLVKYSENDYIPFLAEEWPGWAVMR